LEVRFFASVLFCVIVVPSWWFMIRSAGADARVKLDYDYEEPMNAADWPAPLLATAAANRYDKLTPRSARSH
jgi:hypothetical protein